MKQKRWYHATTKENWKKIKETGYLKRYSYLAPTIKDIDILSKCEVLLSVKYIPTKNDQDHKFELVINNFVPLSNLKVHKYLGR